MVFSIYRKSQCDTEVKSVERLWNRKSETPGPHKLLISYKKYNLWILKEISHKNNLWKQFWIFFNSVMHNDLLLDPSQEHLAQLQITIMEVEVVGKVKIIHFI